MKLSIVSPVYKAENIVPELVKQIEGSIQRITNDYEIILVEDGSPDNSWNVIEQIASKNSKLIGLKLSRNFGQHYAITAGLDHSRGEWIVVMDCDLQDQPDEIDKMYNTAMQGFDFVLASRDIRSDTYFKKFSSKLFYSALGYLTGLSYDGTVANFGIYNRKVIDAVISMKESIRYFPTMVKFVGFKGTKVKVTHSHRLEGRSSYNFGKLFNLAVDIILAYSDKPLRIVVLSGIFISFTSVIIATYYLIKWLLGDMVVLGYTSLIISIWLLSGIIIATLGIVGLYVGKTFEGVKNRPVYITSKKVNFYD